MIGINVQGGTGAGRIRAARTAPWTCGCTITIATSLTKNTTVEGLGARWELLESGRTAHRWQSARLKRCGSCGMRRPS